MPYEKAAAPGEGAAAGNDLGNVDTSQSENKSQAIAHFSNIPVALTERPQWVCWTYRFKFGEKPTKVPLNPHDGTYAASVNPSTWGTFDEAVSAFCCHECYGIGFVLTRDDPFGFIDLDDAWKTDAHGNLIHADPQAEFERQLKIVETFDSYTEKSPSGRGVHIIVTTPGVESGGKRGSVEVYTSGRFMTMTGNVL